jgi:zinc protease
VVQDLLRAVECGAGDCGDIDVKTAREKVEKYFGDIPAGPPVAHQEVWIAKMTGTHRQIVQDRVPQARIYKCGTFPNTAAPMPTISTW